MTRIIIIPILYISLFIVACAEDRPEVDPGMSVEQQINLLIDQDEYEAALHLLSEEDPEDPQISELREKTHLNYGLHSMNTFDSEEMRTRMNNALHQFTEVLRINPENSVAREQIEQIMGVYDTMPDRGPEEEVLEGLREVGFDY